MLWSRTLVQAQDKRWRWVPWPSQFSLTLIDRSLYRQDAYVLGRLLTHELTHAGNVADALRMYEQVRLPFVSSIVQRTRDVGRFYSFSACADGAVPVYGTQEELDRVRKSIEDAWGWQNESEWVWGDAEKRWRAKCGARAKL